MKPIPDDERRSLVPRLRSLSVQHRFLFNLTAQLADGLDKREACDRDVATWSLVTTMTLIATAALLQEVEPYLENARLEGPPGGSTG